MILEKTKFNISKLPLNPEWRLKMKSTLVSRRCLASLNTSYTKTDLIKSINSLDSSRIYGRMLENQKAQCFKDRFLPENDFQNSSTEIPKNNILILEAWKPTKDMKFRLEFFAHVLPHKNSI